MSPRPASTEMEADMSAMNPITQPHDPLFPSPVLLPLSDPGGVQNTIEHTPGTLRPFAATLGVPRLGDEKKHDTTSTRWTESTPGETSHEGNVVTDTVTDTFTDT